MKDLESEKVEFESVGGLLLELKKEFGRGDEKSVKVTELKNVEQGGRTIEKICLRIQNSSKRKWISRESISRGI